MEKLEYVRLTYTDHETENLRTVWAERGLVRKGVAAFWRVNNYGERPEPPEVIVEVLESVHLETAELVNGKLEVTE